MDLRALAIVLPLPGEALPREALAYLESARQMLRAPRGVQANPNLFGQYLEAWTWGKVAVGGCWRLCVCARAFECNGVPFSGLATCKHHLKGNSL